MVVGWKGLAVVESWNGLMIADGLKVFIVVGTWSDFNELEISLDTTVVASAISTALVKLLVSNADKFIAPVSPFIPFCDAIPEP